MPIVALRGHGISALFATAVQYGARTGMPFFHRPPSPHINNSLKPLTDALNHSELHEAFPCFLTHFLSCNSQKIAPIFLQEMQQHFPELLPKFTATALQNRNKIYPAPLIMNYMQTAITRQQVYLKWLPAWAPLMKGKVGAIGLMSCFYIPSGACSAAWQSLQLYCL